MHHARNEKLLVNLSFIYSDIILPILRSKVVIIYLCRNATYMKVYWKSNNRSLMVRFNSFSAMHWDFNMPIGISIVVNFALSANAWWHYDHTFDKTHL